MLNISKKCKIVRKYFIINNEFNIKNSLVKTIKFIIVNIVGNNNLQLIRTSLIR